MLLIPQAPTTAPFLVYISVELTLAGACLMTWLAARSRTLFLSLSAYSFLIAVQLIFQVREQSAWAHAALDLTAPMIVILASQVMHIWQGRWARWWMGALWLVAVLCCCGTLLHWSWLPYDLPINLTEAMLLVQIAIALTRRKGAQRWLSLFFLLGVVTRASLSNSLDRWLGWPHTVAIGGWRWSVGPSSSIILAIVSLVWFGRQLLHDREARQRLESELESARTVQQLLVASSETRLDRVQVEAVYRAHGQVGGDFYQVFPVEGGVLATVGDVSGKGISAAMTVALLLGTLRQAARESSEPGLLLAHLNRALHGRIPGFATCLVARYRYADRTLTVANAGHLAPYRDGEEMAVEGGLPLGLVPEITYRETQMQIGPGERIVFLTDGIVEAQTASGELFGFARTASLSRQPAEAIAAEAIRFGQADDITVLALTFA